MNYTIKVTGINELRAALKAADAKLLVGWRAGLKSAGEIVRADATGRASRYQGIGAYKVRVRGTSVSVEQSKGTVTGFHGDFGPLQLRTALEPALSDNEGAVVNVLETVIDGAIAAL
jgi:hypothetical protein